MLIRMQIPDDVREGAVLRAAHSVRASGVSTGLRRVDGALIRFRLAPQGKKATAIVVEHRPKVLGGKQAAAIRRALV